MTPAIARTRTCAHRSLLDHPLMPTTRRACRAPLLRLIVLALLPLAGCTPSESASRASLSSADAQVIADSIRTLVRSAYDLSAGDVPAQMLSVYPTEGRVVSATAGRVTTTREMLASAVQSFWDGVGRFMVRPSWNWEAIEVDVLSRDVAVMTAQYTVRHWTYTGAPHVIGGVWTAVWQNRGGRWAITNEHLSDLPRATAEAIEAQMPTIAPTTPPDPDSTSSR